MTGSKRYKLYKHKKQWVVGCSAVLMSLAFGVVNAHAATDEAPEMSPVTRSGVTEASSQVQQASEGPVRLANKSAQASVLNDSVSSDKQSAPNQSTSFPTTTQAEPVTAPVASPKNNSTEPQKQYGVRHIQIQYYDHYRQNGVADSDGTGHPRYVNIDQHAVNGRWEEFTWTPPEGTFQDGIPTVPVHIDTQDAEASDLQLYAHYIVRVLEWPTTTGTKVASDTHVIISGYPYSQDITIPAIPFTSDIPAPYHPYMKVPGPDNLAKSNSGQHYLTGGTVHVDPNSKSFTYHGSYSNSEGTLVHRQYRVFYAAPISVEFDDLNGNPYQAAGYLPARYRNVMNVDYGQELTSDGMTKLADRYWKAYMRYSGIQADPTFKVYGYFTPDGVYHDGMPQLTDALENNNSFTFRFVVGHPVDTEDSRTATRTINVTTPDGQTHTVKQLATVSRQITRDAVTDKVLSYGPWSTAFWGEYTPVTIDGYTPSLNFVSRVTVDENTSDQVVNITYLANDESVTIKFVNDDNGGAQVGAPITMTGKTDQSVDVNLSVPDHYELANGQVLPSSYTFTANKDQTLFIHLVEKLDSVDPADPNTNPNPQDPNWFKDHNLVKTITRTIIDQLPGGTQRTVQTATLTRTATYNEVTGELTNLGDWTTSAWEGYSVNVPTGYKIDHIEQTFDGNVTEISTIAPEEVTADTPNQTIIITYQAKKSSPIDDHPTGDDDNGSSTAQAEQSMNEVGTPQVSANDLRVNNPQNVNQNQLPQTGNVDHQQTSVLGILGIILTSLMGIFGIKRKNDGQ